VLALAAAVPALAGGLAAELPVPQAAAPASVAEMSAIDATTVRQDAMRFRLPGYACMVPLRIFNLPVKDIDDGAIPAAR
jgi:hypothetical protein